MFNLVYAISFSQTKEIDSLLNVLNNHKEDSNKVKSLTILSEAFRRAYVNDKAMNYAHAAFDLSVKLSYKKGRGMSYNAISAAYFNFHNYSESLKNCLIALKIFEEIKDKKNIALTYYMIGNVYYMEPNDAEAINYYFKALKLFEELNDLKQAHSILGMIGNTYYYQEKYFDAGNAYERALEIGNKIGDKSVIAFSLKQIGIILWIEGNLRLDAGDTTSALEKYNSAFRKIDTAARIFEKLTDKKGLMETYPFLGNVYEKLGHISIKKGNLKRGNDQLSQALKYNHVFFEMASEANDKNYIGEAANNLGRVYSGVKRFKEARTYLERALRASSKVNLQSIMKDSYGLLAKLDSSEGNFKQALEHYKSYVQLRDSIINAESSKKIVATQMQYEFDKKEDSLHQKQFITQTKLDSQQKQKKYYLAGSILLALLSIFVYLNFRNQKKINKLMDDAHAKEKAELELQSLRAQLNPHFMFNSLNAIQELILKEENEKSQSYLARFAKLLRMLLENADKPFIPLQREIDFLQLYLSLENLRIPDLQFSIDVENTVDTERTMIPNMILQPYIENAIWHGLSHKEKDKQLRIRITQVDGTTNYEIEDNGIGRKRAAELKSLYRKEHKSKGMELLSKRFKLLAKEYGSDIETLVTDKASNESITGTLVTIKVPATISVNK